MAKTRTLQEKLGILADAAKYDASCSSSGTQKRNARTSGGIGSTEGNGICHAYAPDGRCISLLKILLTNACIFDCSYCVNRVSSAVEREAFTPEEVADLTIGFYKRNYIEGLFLSSGIIRSSDHTMEQLVRVAKLLRLDHGFKGYIHLKTIPDASPELIDEAALYADRLSINIELPTVKSLKSFAPEKDAGTIKSAMAALRTGIEAAAEPTRQTGRRKRFAPAGQSTQMIVGADGSHDVAILTASRSLYTSYRLKRVYYSAFSPIPDSSSALPLSAPPLAREHRLYQADWLTRFYGFEVGDIAAAAPDGMLDLEVDPKLAWALVHRGSFPVDVNRAPREMLLRVPGLGVKAVNAILRTRPYRSLRAEDLARLSSTARKAMPFIALEGWHPSRLTDAIDLRQRFLKPARQLDLFAA
ncbi:putative DNA modification/repair radical SAM protein [Acuticoccus sp. MNP-M23]|uniref:putative DNA modification/repair radical SAM protein n=1 Tax=Acuticoccus sp. MNP-M23 TaxID=3072793 RepID=UPI00281683DF|nr:putative DNA modification/repair radical SAM protein [Acuticoccus sp. MNP-M23]WMS41229.1 putative DNA modification/repair radical SAM protein [Acuticoccus sp. MNP-M23]